LTVDAEGCVWSARWGRAAVMRHGTDGKVLDSIRLPVTNITSVCFGGDHLDRLFITSAQEAGKKAGSAGWLFQIRLNVRGASEFKSRVGLG
jgi:sugar lactone lactonase YvrE